MVKDICGRGEYNLGGSKEDTIGLPVSISNLPEKIELEGCSLNIRTSFHVSLVAIGIIIEKHKITIPDFFEKVVSNFCEFVKDNPIKIDCFRDEYKFVSENEKRSVVVMCDILNINKFFDFINEKYNLQIEYPPTHVTLYTLQKDKGIFLTDSKDIKTMTKSITNWGFKFKWNKF